MKAIISKGQPHSASIKVPSSKSMMHRAFIASSLSDGISVIQNASFNEDILATRQCLEKLGASFEEKNDSISVTGIKQLPTEAQIYDCNQSASTLRFLLPLVSVLVGKGTFIGSKRLLQRPFDIYRDIFHQQNLSFVQTDNEIRIDGHLKSDHFLVRGDLSSQFISGLFFALPLLKESSAIEIIPPLESKPYVDMTIHTLQKAGITIQEEGYVYTIPGNQRYQSNTWVIEADYSQAAFFACLAVLLGKEILLLNLKKESLQGDAILFDYLKQMGASISYLEQGISVSGTITQSITIDLAQCPDLGPIFFALASQLPQATTFLNTKRLRLKESNRIQSMKEELKKIGCVIQEEENQVVIEGNSPIQGGISFFGHQDHRVVMALSILCALSERANSIDGIEAIQKSYPEFFEHLKETGVCVQIEKE